MRSLVAGYGAPAFPHPICISVNEVLLHGVVDPLRPIEAGDIVRLDLAAVDIDSGEAVDSAITFMVQGWGTNRQLVTETRKRMFDESLKAAELALAAGIKKVVPGGLVRDASRAMRGAIRSRSAVCLEAYGYGLSGLSSFTGHGIGGGEMHMDPSIPSYPGEEAVEGAFVEGRTYCLEPMVYPYVLPEDHNRFWILPDGWSVRVPSDRGAHVEHTVILTLPSVPDPADHS
jgi:methionyl aminopeptidase